MHRSRRAQRIYTVLTIAAGACLTAACGSNVHLGTLDPNSGGAGGSGGAPGLGGGAPTGGTLGAGGAVPSGGTTSAGAGGGGINTGGTTRVGGSMGSGGTAGVGGTGGAGKTCGGLAGLPCVAGEVCDLGLSPLCASDGFGTCVVKPQGCTTDWNPVCGCDGKTYSNDCARLAAAFGNVARRSDGACPTIDAGAGGGAGGATGTGGRTGGGGTSGTGGTTGVGGTGGTGKTCGGLAGLPCATGEVCDLGLNPLCASDSFGTCVVKPGGCTTDWNPVCGCDGKTYSNDCTRLSSSFGNVARRSDGACPTDAGAGGSAGTGGSTGAGGNTGTNGCLAVSSSDTLCVGTNPPHYYACVGTVPSASCVQVAFGNMTDGYCCP